jgi:single-strand DNA-binding protein
MQFTLTFEGNLAADSELRITESGKAICKFRVGHKTRRRNPAGEWVNGKTMWVTVTAWETLAERVAELFKGDTVIIDARDDLNAWAYLNQEHNTPAAQFQVTAVNVSLSLRFNGATSPRSHRRQRRRPLDRRRRHRDPRTRTRRPTRHPTAWRGRSPHRPAPHPRRLVIAAQRPSPLAPRSAETIEGRRRA